MYSALVFQANNIKKHPNADKLYIVQVNGYQIITGSNIQPGQMMVFFEAGGQISEEYLAKNNEFRPKYLKNANQQGVNVEEAVSLPGGFFEESRRVRPIKLRGMRSDGYIVPVSTFEYLGVDTSAFKPGMLFNSLAGKTICEKYVSPATRQAQERLKAQGVKVRDYGLDMFHKHFDTAKLRRHLGELPEVSNVVITEKLHGSSGRTGSVLADDQDRWYERAAKHLGLRLNKRRVWKTVTGTRRVVRYMGENLDLRPDLNAEDHDTRVEIHKMLDGALHQGETLYYEIVGHWSNGSPIFTHGVKKEQKDLRKRYKHSLGESMRMDYTYGTEPGQYQMYVYRITRTNQQGHSVDLDWNQIQRRCSELGLRTVPQVGVGTVYRKPGNEFEILRHETGEREDFLKQIEIMSTGPSTLDNRHIMEGVCIRVVSSALDKTYKFKSADFCELESIAYTGDNYVDIEDVN